MLLAMLPTQPVSTQSAYYDRMQKTALAFLDCVFEILVPAPTVHCCRVYTGSCCREFAGRDAVSIIVSLAFPEHVQAVISAALC